MGYVNKAKREHYGMAYYKILIPRVEIQVLQQHKTEVQMNREVKIK